MKNINYEIILQSLTEDLLRRDAKIKDLERRYNELKAVHTADVKLYWQKDHQVKELQSSIDKLINEKKELVKSLQNSSPDKKKEDTQQKTTSECIDLVSQIYTFCKEHNLKLSMDFENDKNDPKIIIWDYTGNVSICQIVYSTDWITTLNRLLDSLKNGYEMWAESKKNDGTVANKHQFNSLIVI